MDDHCISDVLILSLKILFGFHGIVSPISLIPREKQLICTFSTLCISTITRTIIIGTTQYRMKNKPQFNVYAYSYETPGGSFNVFSVALGLLAHIIFIRFKL